MMAWLMVGAGYLGGGLVIKALVFDPLNRRR